MNDAGQEDEKVSLGRRTFFNSRAFLLFLLLSGIMLTLARPVADYFNQQQRITSLEQQIAANKDLIAELQAQVDRWSDPAYVKAQAHTRLRYVMPGEIGYVVVESREAPVVVQMLPSRNSSVWYRVMWQSMKDASRTAAPSGDTGE